MRNASLLNYVVLLFLLAGCEKKSSSILKEKTLRMNFQVQPVTIDSRRNGDPFSSALLFMLFEGLTHLNPDGSISLGVAKSIDISEDYKTYTFHLKKTYWSDGTALTSFDFEKTWKKILDPHFPSLNAYLFYTIKNAEAAKKGRISLSEVGILALDAQTLRIELEQPTPYFLELVSFCNFFPTPSHILDMHKSTFFNYSDQFVCNGPFKVSKWQHEKEIELTKNPAFWNQEKVYLDKIIIQIIFDEMTSLQMFERGETDLISEPSSSFPIEAIPTLLKKKLLHTKPIAGTMICSFNTEKFPFSNKNLRKAFAYAIERKGIVKNITQCNELIAKEVVPPVLKASKKKALFKDNRKLANEYFTKALNELKLDKKSFSSITLTYYSNELQHSLAQAIQAGWRDILGIDIKLQQLDFKIFLDQITRRNHEIALVSWIAQYNDPMNILERFKTRYELKNYSGWEHPEYISLLERSLFTKNLGKRLEILEKAETLLIDEMPFAPIFHFNHKFLCNPRIKGIDITPIGNLELRYTKVEN